MADNWPKKVDAKVDAEPDAGFWESLIYNASICTPMKLVKRHKPSKINVFGLFLIH